MSELTESKFPAPCYHIEWDDMGFGKVCDSPSDISVPGWSTRGMHTMQAKIDALTAERNALKRFYKKFDEEWPGGLDEVTACWTNWKIKAEAAESRLAALEQQEPVGYVDPDALNYGYVIQMAEGEVKFVVIASGEGEAPEVRLCADFDQVLTAFDELICGGNKEELASWADDLGDEDNWSWRGHRFESDIGECGHVEVTKLNLPLTVANPEGSKT